VSGTDIVKTDSKMPSALRGMRQVRYHWALDSLYLKDTHAYMQNEAGT
jgi:hypothetical protein